MNQITNKQRILKIKDIFLRKSDENHKLSFEDILDLLKIEYGSDYEVSIRAIKNDVKTLIESDTYLVEDSNKYGKKMFSQQNRLLEMNELRTLIDSISSAGSISTSDKRKLINKIKKLTSDGMAKNLSNQIYSDFKIINKDKSFRYNVDTIHISIQNHNKIKFKYGRYNLKRKFVLNEKSYKVQPYDLVWENGFYYLVAFDENKDTIINFRVDRMRDVSYTDDKYKKDLEFNLSDHLNNCFNMYPGDVSSIDIKFHKHLINAIIDRFGTKIIIEPMGEDHFILHTRAAINTGLIRWILNWGSDAEVLKPQKLIDEMKRELEKMHEIYKI